MTLVFVTWLLLVGCGSGSSVAAGSDSSSDPTGAGSPVPVLDVAPVELVETGDACIDFYRAAQESKIEEAIYMRAFADRIMALGHDEAGAVLSDLADQWDVGVWEGEQDEVWQSGFWARAGALLGQAGAVRCADLAEWWGIDGYEGEPDRDEMVQRQVAIWEANELPEYYLLVAANDSGTLPTQIQTHVVDGMVREVRVAMSGPIDADQLPTSVEAVYQLVLDQRLTVADYNLVHASPKRVQLADDGRLVVKLDTQDFPSPLEVLGDGEE